jgi:hypothetical protein
MVEKEIDQDLASKVSKQLLDAYLSVENATRLIQENCSKTEFEGFRSEAGRVAGGLYALLEPLWRLYPELAPEGLVLIAPKKRRRGN